MTFENPSAFLSLIFLPFLLCAIGFPGWTAKKEMAELFHLDIRLLKKNQVKKYIKAGVAIAFLIGSFALPEIPFSSTAAPKRAGEIILLVDVSGSMGAKKSASTNRLERVKPILTEINNRMEELGEVRISLHAFTSIARSHVPFVGKEDYPYLRESIKRLLDINSIPGEGSSLGRPISNVAGKFSKDEKVKLIVMFSDGEAFLGLTRGIQETERGFLEEAIKKARAEGIKVVTVGVGEKEGAKIPLWDETIGWTGEYAKLQGVDYVTHLEEAGLKELAFRTGGKYFFEKNQEELTDFISANLRLARAEEVPQEVKGHRSVAHWIILGALPMWVIFTRRYLS
jgi:hypothetical protein